MAKTISEEEIQLRKRARRRLVGAITLAIAAIVILPMVLDNKPEQHSQEIDIRIPSEDGVDELSPEPVPFEQTPIAAAPEKPATGIQRENQAGSSLPVKPAPLEKKTSKKPDPITEGRAPDAKAEPTVAGATFGREPGQFVVQLGAFSEPAKARQQLQSLIAKDIATFTNAKAYTETLRVDRESGKGDAKEAGKREITRVRVGFFGTREEAEKAREKLKALGFDGVVTDK
ncbi:MAG: SPOR domain-containing protein [Nitrosospira sp.]|nr:SPOR domain-containing protein [Nitrosospira sp.]